MTLLLSVLTQDYVVQVSDRRVVMLPGARLRDDDSVKAVLLHGHAAFAYTGLARLPASEAARAARGEAGGYRDTSEWLAEVLSLGSTLDEVLTNLKVEAADAISRAPTPLRNCAQAFVGIGWEGDPLEPVLYQVWNYGKGRVAKDFELATGRLEGEEYGAHSSRQLPPMIDNELNRRLTDCMKRGLGPSATARVLVETVRSVARGDRTVGRGVIQVCLPRGPVQDMQAEKEWLMSAHAPNLEHITFQHLPAYKDDGVPYSPVMVLGGLITPRLILGDNVLKLKSNSEASTASDEDVDNDP
jgi:hypothetical protein